MVELEYFKVRITDQMYSDYTGQLGAYLFESGVSTTKLHRNDAINVSHGFACEAIDDNGKKMFDVISGQIPTVLDKSFELKKETPSKKEASPKPLKEDATISKKPLKTFTRDQLEKIADEQGLKGLRDAADSLGIKGRSIPELIERILKAQE